jgi:hypothetical protein
METEMNWARICIACGGVVAHPSLWVHERCRLKRGLSDSPDTWPEWATHKRSVMLKRAQAANLGPHTPFAIYADTRPLPRQTEPTGAAWAYITGEIGDVEYARVRGWRDGMEDPGDE